MKTKAPIRFFVFLAVLFLLPALLPAMGDPIHRTIDDFKNGLSSKWEEKSFEGHTRYQVVEMDGRAALEAVAEASASGLYYKETYDPEEFPWLAWSWKVEDVLKKGNALTREGDDYPARVYVVFDATFFWRTKALCYVWANRLEKGRAVPNAFVDNAMMIAVESGPDRTGKWVSESVNILKDYKKYFGEKVPKVRAVALMTDTDNTGESARAWYGPIRISSAPPDTGAPPTP